MRQRCKGKQSSENILRQLKSKNFGKFLLWQRTFANELFRRQSVGFIGESIYLNFNCCGLIFRRQLRFDYIYKSIRRHIAVLK
jgi:hypothetical protein